MANLYYIQKKSCKMSPVVFLLIYLIYTSLSPHEQSPGAKMNKGYLKSNFF